MEVVALAGRRYLLFRPAGGPPAGGWPLVVFLHGTGGTAEWAADETRLPGFADRAGFLLAVPEALPPDPGRPPKFLSNPSRWADGPAYDPAGPPLPDDAVFLDAVLDDALARRPADRRRVYLTGFSNGAGMAFRYAAERPDRLAAIAPVAGPCRVADPRPARPVPTLYLTGAADPLFPLRGGEVRVPWGNRLVRRPPAVATLERWAAAIGCQPESVVESDADGVRVEVFPPGDGGAEFRAITVAGLGHHWPGGLGRLNPRIGGPPSDRLDANEVIWEFFRRHALP